MNINRPITSGSRQAPDPYDQFLESRGHYRKHTARDASCLFRVIAEQMYDAQMLHYEVRLECVRFMTNKRRIFEQQIEGDFDSYMMDMAKPKTYGTLLELRALCCMYRRNVVLFEPFTLGTSVTYDEAFKDEFRVFYTNEYHFDSVYTVNDIETAAVCQAISFKLLYKMLFKLPDVGFAVEMMLHPETFDWGKSDVQLNDRGYISRFVCYNGQQFQLDLPESTKCILENDKLCQFHNNPKVQQDLLNGLRAGEVVSFSEKLEAFHMCPNRLTSCVRQLLADGITPFPYKVAKSLDANMYRNIEFDCWNDVRKEAKRYNLYTNDYNFKVGAKCRVELMTEADMQMHTCHIQKITADKAFCVVYVEYFGKKIWVPFGALHPMPPDEFRPWAVPYRYQRHRMHLAKLANKPKMQKWKKTKIFDIDNYFEASKAEMPCFQNDSHYGNTHLPNEQHELETEQQEQCFHVCGKPSRLVQQQQQEKAQQPMQVQHSPQPSTVTEPHLMQTPPTPVQPQFGNYMPLGGRPTPLPMPTPIPAPWPGAPLSPDGSMLMHIGGYMPPPLARHVHLSPPAQSAPLQAFGPPPFMFSPPPAFMISPHGTRANNVGLNNNNSNKSGNSNVNNNNNNNNNSNNNNNNNINNNNATDKSEPRHSINTNGEDLPVDRNTLRYFYNIGVDAWHNQNYHNTDQQQQKQQQQQPHRNEEAYAVSAINNTPPNTPDAAVPPVINLPTNNVEQSTVDKTRARVKRNTGAFNKTPRNKQRPEHLHDLNKEGQQTHAAMMLPTPNLTPNSCNNQFNFYPTPPTPLPPTQPPFPVYFPGNKDVQTPFAWHVAPPPSAASLINLPYEMVNTYSIEPNAVNVPKLPPAAVFRAPPRQ